VSSEEKMYKKSMRKSSGNIRAVLGNVELLVDILKVLDELLLTGEAFGPGPVAPKLLDRKLVHWDRGICTSTGVAIPEPDSSEAARGLQKVDGVTKLAQFIELVDATCCQM
jgi:hypothetical protein